MRSYQLFDSPWKAFMQGPIDFWGVGILNPVLLIHFLISIDSAFVNIVEVNFVSSCRFALRLLFTTVAIGLAIGFENALDNLCSMTGCLLTMTTSVIFPALMYSRFPVDSSVLVYPDGYSL